MLDVVTTFFQMWERQKDRLPLKAVTAPFKNSQPPVTIYLPFTSGVSLDGCLKNSNVSERVLGGADELQHVFHMKFSLL